MLKMRQLIVFSLVVFTTILSLNFKSHGQNSEELLEMKLFGLGLHFEKFGLKDFIGDNIVIPKNKILFIINPTQHFRIEPNIGFIFSLYRDGGYRSRTTNWGLGTYGMFQRGETNFYGGIKLDYAKITNEYLHLQTENWIISNVIKSFAVGPVVGAEFFFGEHFSFGGELGLKYMISNMKNQCYLDQNNRSYFTSNSGLLLRFYF
jgi:hypothetical protein